ncbi:hypothetical protein Tco_0412373 [Tanacetum coccineum]
MKRPVYVLKDLCNVLPWLFGTPQSPPILFYNSIEFQRSCCLDSAAGGISEIRDASNCFVISNRGRLLGITDLMITKPINRNEERRNKRKQDMLKKETRSRLMLIEININVEDID